MKYNITLNIEIVIILLAMTGCIKDRTDYMHSKYKQLDIAELQNIQGTGYRLEGSGEFYNKLDYTYLFFCKNNRYAYATAAVAKIGAKIYRGTYTVNLATNQVIMTGDDVDAQGKHLQGVFYTPSGYFEQEVGYTNKGMGIKFYDIYKINPSYCDVKKEAI